MTLVARFQSQDTESAYIEEMAQRLAALQGIDNSQSAMPTIHGQMMRGLHGHGGYYPSMNESSSGGRGSGGSFRGGSGGRYRGGRGGAPPVLFGGHMPQRICVPLFTLACVAEDLD